MPGLSKSTDKKKLQLTLFSGMCESGKFSPYVHPNEALAVISPCSGRRRRDIVTCQDDGRDQDLQDVSGLNMMDVRLTATHKRLPKFIPIIPKGLFKCPGREIPSKTVGVVLNDVLTKKLSAKCGYLRLPPGSKPNLNALTSPAFRAKRVILFSTGPDTLIETLWWQRHQHDIFKTISTMGFAAVTGMNFSVFSGECPFAHALNIKKSLCYCKELEKLGVWTIPHIYAINNHQRERWKSWLLANPSVKMVTINTQLQRKEFQSMNEVFKTVDFLLENTTVKIIIHGGIKGLDALIKKFPKRIHHAASLKRAVIRKDKTPAQFVNVCRDLIRATVLS